MIVDDRFFLLKSIFDFKGKEIVIVTTPTIDFHLIFKSFFLPTFQKVPHGAMFVTTTIAMVYWTVFVQV
jgi:hypothetical protein